MAELEDLGTRLQKLQSVVWANLSGPALAEAVAELTQLRHQFDAVDLSAVGAFDASKEHTVEGHASSAAYLVQRCKERPATAKRRSRLARAVRAMPHVAEALAAGQISLDRVDAITKVRLPSLIEAFERDEERLVKHARDLHYDDLLRALRYWSDINAPDDADARARQQEDERFVSLVPTFEGAGDLTGTLTPFARRIVADVLERIERELWEADWAEARERLGDAATSNDLRRTPRQRRHDALVEMAKRAMTTNGPGREPEWVINMKLDPASFAVELEKWAAEVLGEDPELIPYPEERECELDDGTILTPAQAISVGVGGYVRRIVIGPDDEIINLGQKERFFLEPLRTALKMVFAKCTHRYGCDIPSRWCEIDHLLAYIDGGPTDAANGGPKCKRHNLWKELQDRKKRRRP